MSAYDEQLKQIRAARAARDQSREKLHEQLLEQLKLLRAQRKADSKETVADPAVQAEIAALRDRISKDAEKLRAIRSELAAIAQLEIQIQDAKKLLDQLNSDLEKLDQALAAIDAELNSPNTTPERRAELE